LEGMSLLERSCTLYKSWLFSGYDRWSRYSHFYLFIYFTHPWCLFFRIFYLLNGEKMH
jgi:hypothetical protein